MKTQPRFHDSFPMKNREGGVGSRKSIAISEVNVLELTLKYLEVQYKLKCVLSLSDLLCN